MTWMIRVTGKAEMTRMTGMKGMTTKTWVTGMIRMNINEITWVTGTIWMTGMICMIRINTVNPLLQAL